MNVKVERISGNKYRLYRNGLQIDVRGDQYGDWTRAVAQEAKRLIKVEWDIEPSKVRFMW